MNKKLIGTLLTIGLGLVVLGVGCQNAVPNNSSQTTTNKTPIKIGFIGPLSGDAAEYGQPIKNSVALAAEQINASGGINGRPLQILYEDGACNGQQAAAAAQKLVNIDAVKFIIGGVCSGETLAMAPITNAAQVLSISPASTNPSITNAGDYVFRNIPSDADSGLKLAELAAKYPTVAIISEETDYNQAIKQVFQKNYHGQIVADENYAQDSRDFRTNLTKIEAANPTAIIINAQTGSTGGLILKEIKQMRINVPILGNMAMVSSEALTIAKNEAEGVVAVDAPTLNENSPKAKSYLNDYVKQYGSKPSYEIYGGAAYDDVELLAQAIRSVGMNSSAVRDYLYQLPNYDGVIGNYHFDHNGDLVGLEFQVKKIVNGQAVPVSF